jgi:enterochelin esterase-like enzyme
MMMISIRSRLKNEPAPLIDGNKVTFVWQGEEAPQLLGDFTDWESGRPVTLKEAEKGVWLYEVEFPEDAYIEYNYMDGDQRLKDPLNPRRVLNGISGYNHYFFMPRAHRTPLSYYKKGAPRGRVIRYQLPTRNLIAGNTRTVYLYQPPTTEPCPLVVVWDGRDYLQRGKLAQIVDNLILQERICPIAMALVENGRYARFAEYGCSDSTLIFLMEKVLPLAEAELNLINISEQPGAYGVLGASMGGLMALYTAIRFPEIFGNVISQSGAFRYGIHDSVIFEWIKKFDLRSIRIWMDVGVYDFVDLLEANRRLYPQMVGRGYDVTYQEFPAGHNYPAWRNEVWQGLEVMFKR